MFKYRPLMDSHVEPTAAEGTAHSRRSSFAQPNEEFHSQFSEDDFQRQLEEAGFVHSRVIWFRYSPRVTGPGGVFLPRTTELIQLLDQGPESVSVMCFTWNIAGKVGSLLAKPRILLNSSGQPFIVPAQLVVYQNGTQRAAIVDRIGPSGIASVHIVCG